LNRVVSVRMTYVSTGPSISQPSREQLGASICPRFGEGRTVLTRIPINARIVRETGTYLTDARELHTLMLRIRQKGARWAYDVDYESIFELGAKKRVRAHRLSGSNKGGRSRWFGRYGLPARGGRETWKHSRECGTGI
jgi:hypothetical protein